MTGHDAPTRTDPVAAALSEVVGGPLGDHAGGHRWWGPARVLVGATAVVLAAGMLGKAACVPSGWGRADQPYAQQCWTDLAGASIDSADPPRVATWLQRLAELAPGSGTVATTAALAVLLGALVLLATALLVRVDPRRPWAAAGWAMSPVLLAHWLSWEVLAAVGVAVMLWGWSTGRAWWAGVGAGVGTAFALPVAVAFLAVVAVGGRLRDRVDAVVAAAAAYVVITLPGRGSAPSPDLGSIWFALEQVGVDPSTTHQRIVQGLVLVAAAAAAVQVVRLSGRATPATSARAGLLLLAAALAVAPASPPELDLVLLPLAAVALTRWRDLLVWQGCALVSSVITGWWVGQAVVPTVTDDERAYWLAVLLRLAGLAWLVVAVLRAAYVEGSADDDAVEVGRGEPDPDLDVLADAGHPGA